MWHRDMTRTIIEHRWNFEFTQQRHPISHSQGKLWGPYWEHFRDNFMYCKKNNCTKTGPHIATINQDLAANFYYKGPVIQQVFQCYDIFMIDFFYHTIIKLKFHFAEVPFWHYCAHEWYDNTVCMLHAQFCYDHFIKIWIEVNVSFFKL